MSDAGTSQAPADEADYREQVLERFTMRARALTNQFTILMIFAFGFLVFVIVPLAALNFDAAHVAAQKAEIEALTAQSEELEAERAALEEEVGILRGNIGSLNSVLEDKRQDAEERTGARGTLKKRLADNGADRQRLLTQAQGLESAVNGIKKVAGLDVGQHVAELFRRAGAEDEVDAERRRAVRRRGRGQGELSAVKKTFGERLEANQDFWQSITGKELFMDGLSDDFNQAFENITGIVNLRLDKIAQQSTRLEAEIAELAQAGQALEDDLAVLDEELKAIQAETAAKFQELGDKDSAIEGNEREQAKLTEQVAQIQEQLATLPDPEDIEQEREDIEERLASFESPFGVIPIGLKEAVLAYPLILAAGFMVCVLLLARLLALRREFRNSLARDQALSEADVDRRVATLAPLWFDAGRAFWANPAMVLALLIPFVLFVASGWLILNDWLLQLGDTASATNLRAFYAGLYALGLAIFVAGLLRVQSAWAQDRAMPASANPVPPA
jgi:cell division protein FtsB